MRIAIEIGNCKMVAGLMMAKGKDAKKAKVSKKLPMAKQPDSRAKLLELASKVLKDRWEGSDLELSKLLSAGASSISRIKNFETGTPDENLRDFKAADKILGFFGVDIEQSLDSGRLVYSRPKTKKEILMAQFDEIMRTQGVDEAEHLIDFLRSRGQRLVGDPPAE